VGGITADQGRGLMPSVVRFAGPRAVSLVEEPSRPLAADQVRLRTLYSGISAGTELTAYRGSNPYLTKRWDGSRRLFIDQEVSFEYPIDGWGYEEVGEVVEAGADAKGVSIGDRVWGAWGHRSEHVGPAAWAARRVMPANLDSILGIFSQIGAIALNAILDADIHLGEVVAVFGQGPPGLIATALAGLNGGTVVAVDGIEPRLRLARQMGAAHLVDFGRGSPAEAIRELTADAGADVSIEFSGITGALNEAIRSTAYNSRVVASGFFQGGADGLFLGEEFHHNRIQIVCSQISGINSSLDHRWNELRLQQTVMRLQAEGRLDLKPLVSHVIAATDVANAFRLLDERQAEAVQVVLDFGAAS
jgi:2-desacetyl-2-hydroxyethyl bacteriochlorophyllide A dehydrogenase